MEKTQVEISLETQVGGPVEEAQVEVEISLEAAQVEE